MPPALHPDGCRDNRIWFTVGMLTYNLLKLMQQEVLTWIHGPLRLQVDQGIRVAKLVSARLFDLPIVHEFARRRVRLVEGGGVEP